MSFIAELKRRRVFRVAGAYLVAAWVVLQVVATLLPAFDLPSWTLKLVAILAVIGFPIALVVGWVFDITPGGIERTDPNVRFQFPIRAAVGGTLIVLVGVVGFLTVRRRLNAAGIDENAVVVIPFRVSGDAKLATMREGMVDLIAPKLTGEGGPRAVDSRTTLSAWRSATKSSDDDIAPADAIKLARKLRAAKVILGEVVGTPGAIELNARVYSTIDGTGSDPARVRAKPDSLLSAVDALVSELLVRNAGAKDRLSVLLTESLPAVQAYLDGNRNYRLGKYEEAAKKYGDATDLDTTFALASYGELMAREWTGHGPRYNLAAQRAVAFRERLPAREKALVLARFGENFPTPLSPAEALRRWEATSSQYADSPELWYQLGDHYFHYGGALGYEDSEERALKAWSRAIALDSTFAPAWGHQLQIHAGRGDTANARKVYAKLKELHSDEAENVAAWTYAAAMNDDTLRDRLLREAPTWKARDFNNITIAVSMSGLSTEGLDELQKIYTSTPTSDTERRQVANQQVSYALERGRLQTARRLLASVRSREKNDTLGADYVVWVTTLYPELGVDSVEPVMPLLRASTRPYVSCRAGLWDALNGRVKEAQHAMQIQEQWLAIDTLTPWRKDLLRRFHQLNKAALAVVMSELQAKDELQRMDSLIVNGPVGTAAEDNYLATILARLYARMGDQEKARSAAQRGNYAAQYKMTQVLELARAASKSGHREQAIRSYRIYLSYRDPEPGPAKVITDQARAELAALVAHSQ